VSFSEEKKSHSFIQFFDGINVSTQYFEFDLADFQYSKKQFDISIGKNSFNSEGFELDIKQNNHRIKGKITLDSLVPWPVKLFSPGAMGWYRFVPFMECYHGVLGFNHSLNGKIEINGKTIDFSGGRGYIEKDYGSSFPRYYVWMQSNHFEIPGVSIMASLANIPWLGSSFDGFIVGLLFDGVVYRFTTYTGAKMTRFNLDDRRIVMHFQDKKYRIEMEALKSEGVNLQSPVEGSMTGRILESITSQIYVKLVKLNKNTEEIIFEGTGKNAGLDIGGKVEEIQSIP
ncbi:MAG: tocopherol cyclase family protein, partial [Candidatus Heimdallarchaeaceae archaeon]